MNAEELQQILNAQTAQFQQILATVTNQLTEQFNLQLQQQGQTHNAAAGTSVYNNLTPFENLDLKKEKFVNYLERIENYFLMKNVTDPAKKAQLLCTSIGSRHYNKLAAFLGPEKAIKNLTYDELVTEFKQLLSPIRSSVVAQHYFLETYQLEKHNIAEYVAALQQDIANCEFTVTCECEKQVSCADIFLRAQFIRGLREPWLKEQILQSSLTKFDEILTKALALEASRLESKELVKTTPNSVSFSPEVNKISRAGTSNRESRPTKSDRHHNQQSSNKNRHSNHSSQRQPSKTRQPESKSKIDYKKLGIDGLCLRCGRNNHRSYDCRIDRNRLTCNTCQKQGHTSKVCITSLLQNFKSKEAPVKSSSPVASYSQYDCVDNYTIVDCFTSDEEKQLNIDDKYYATVTINNKPLQMEVDSGAKFALIPIDKFKELNLRTKIKPTKLAFRSFNGGITPALGKAVVNVRYKNHCIQRNLYLVPPGKATLMGRSWIRPLNVVLAELETNQDTNSSPSYSINSVETDEIVELIINEFPNTFEQKIGRMPTHTVKLQLRDNAKPRCLRERTVPFALRKKVEEELDLLEKSNIITPVPTSDWASPLVIIPKPDGRVRLAIDYKTTVNDQLVDAKYPIQRIDEILHNLREAHFFCKLDLYHAYLHVPVDEDSSNIQSISTHKGTFRVNRLNYGIKTAPSEFNRIMSQILQPVPGTEFYFDDIIVHGRTIEECTQNLRSCLQVLQKHDLHLNKKKCSFFAEKTTYLGYVVTHGKICKSPEKTAAIELMPQPRNQDELRRFLGLSTYYHQFIPNLATLTAPLRKLLCKNVPYIWTAECNTAFSNLKKEICSDRTIIPFDPEKPIILSTDASPVGVGAVLSHWIDNQEKPIAFASRALTAAEQNYSQLDREALAIIFATTQFYNYLLGNKFTLVTDNQALSRIFASNNQLPRMTSARLLRYASFLSQFDYQVKFKRGEDNKNTDCLSRAPINPQIHIVENFEINPDRENIDDFLIGFEVNQLHHETVLSITTEFINPQTIANETQKDLELKELLQQTQNQCSDMGYSVTDGILFRNNRIVVPASLRTQILEDLHYSHIGTTKMKQLARCYVTWKGIDSQIEAYVKACPDCAQHSHNPPKAPIHPWEVPKENWDRIHIDYAGPFLGHYFLVCIDAKSKWCEIGICKDAPTSDSTIKHLSNMFAVHGFPLQLVSDNAAIFKSREFETFCNKRGIHQRFIAPHFPQTNGLAERNVQTLKRRLKLLSNDPTPLKEKIREIIFRYHATPLASGKSPAELYLGRRLRIKFDAMFPYQEPKHKILVQSPRTLQEEDRVQARIFQRGKFVWSAGIIKKVYGSRHYLVQLDSDGRTLKCHIDQIRSSLIPKKTVQFGPTTSNNVPRGPSAQQQQQPVPAAIQAPENQPPSQENQPLPPQGNQPLDLPVMPPAINQPNEHQAIAQRPRRNAPPPVKFKDYYM